jgi:type I restriction enzyme S subunit
MRLGDVCLVERGTVVTKSMTSGGDVPVIAGGLEPAYMHDRANRPAGAITVSASGANAGYVNWWDVPIFASDCSTVLPHAAQLDGRFTYYFLKSHQSYIQQELRRGAAQPHVYAKDLANLEIRFPSLAEQKRIVDKLEKTLPQIEVGLATLGAADRQIQDLFLSTLNETFRDSTSAPVKSFAEVAQLSLGKMLDRGKATGNHKTPYLRNVNVRWGEFNLADISEMDITPEEFERVAVKSGDVVVCEGGEPGRCAVWRHDESMAIQKALHRMRPTAEMDSDYLALNLEYQVKCGSASEFFTGTTIKHLTGEKLRVMRLPVPPLDEQKFAVQKLAAVRASCRALSANNSARRAVFADLRQSILEAAFRGEF